MIDDDCYFLEYDAFGRVRTDQTYQMPEEEPLPPKLTPAEEIAKLCAEVERLRLANQRLREAVRAALDSLHCWDGEESEDDIHCSHRCGRCDETVDRNGPVRAQLRAALEESEKE